MIKLFSKKFVISLISSLLISTGIILACAGGWWEEYGNSNFTPELFADKAYSPFFYSYNFYYGINHDEQHNERFNKQVIEDWNKYFDKKYSASELNYLLFKTNANSVDSIIKGINQNEN